MKRRRITVFFTALLVLCMAGAALVLHRINQLRAGVTLQEVLYIPSAKVLKRMSLGYNGLLADIYWTRVVQYFGGKHRESAMQYKLLAPLLDITTELDPHLIVAYQFGSIFVSQRPPEGAGEPDKAVELMERGIRVNPTEWRLYYNLGFIHYWERHDFLAAERAFERGSKVPGVQPFVKIMAAAMAHRAADINTARLLWTQIYETTKENIIRDNAIKHLTALQVDEDIIRLEAAIRAYKEATGHVPHSWAELRAAGWRGRLIDPLGLPYRLEADGSVRVQDPKQLPFITKGLPPGLVQQPYSPTR